MTRILVIDDDEDVRATGHIAERLFPSVVALELPPQIQLYDRIFVDVYGGTESLPHSLTIRPSGVYSRMRALR
jgi:hypothetical protein